MGLLPVTLGYLLFSDLIFETRCLQYGESVAWSPSEPRGEGSKNYRWAALALNQAWAPLTLNQVWAMVALNQVWATLALNQMWAAVALNQMWAELALNLIFIF